MTDTDKNAHAIRNARAWAESILEAMTAYKALEKGEGESVTYDGETFTDADELRQRIEEMPLSVAVRGGWYSPGDEDKGGEAEEFQILLSTGGPALRLVGDIGSRASLEYQDWGIPWTEYRETTDAEDDAIEAFVGLFWFGD